VRGSAEVEHLRDLEVLVVDDNETNRVILRRALGAWGCRTLEAESGGAALRLLAACAARGQRPGLAILDMQMPEMDGRETARRIHADPRFAGLPLILLSSIGALAEARQIGFSEALAKPVRQATLLRAILAALGRPAEEPDAAREPGGAFAPLSERLRVLLAEDNRVNRLVALQMLRRVGCDVDSATTGREAVAAVAANQYDLVLMDVQMPEMDGFEATAEIRRHEAPGHRLPIIAMTAHAMTGDQERCLAAGMDDYVAKPVTRVVLVEMLERWIGERRVRARSAPAAAAPGDEAVGPSSSAPPSR
jgi:CheY-like chemotaxis protein